MRKLSKLLTGIFVTLSISTPVSAAENIISFEKEAGITPDSMLYPVDKLIDEASVALTSNEEKKVEILTETAKERLGESEVMVEEGKQDLVEEALVEYEVNMNEAVEVVDNIIEEAQKADDKDVIADETTELTNEELADIEKEQDEIEKLNELLTQQQEKSIEVLEVLEVLEELQDTVNDEAKTKLEQVIEMQVAKKEAVAKLVEKRHEFNEQKKALNMAKVQLKKASKTGDEEAIKKAEEDYQLKLNSYNEAKQNMVEAKGQHKEVVKAYSGKENVDVDQDKEDQEEPMKVQEEEQQKLKQEQSKQEEPKKEQEKQQQQPKQEQPKQEQPKQEQPKKEQPKQQQPKQEEPNKEQEKNNSKNN